MSVTNEDNKVSYVANGGTLYTVPFYFEIATDIKLYINDILQVYGTNYTVTGAGLDGGGSLTIIGTAPVSPAKLTVIRDVPIKQLNSFNEGGPFQAKTIEKMFDKLTQISQQVAESASRAVKLPVSSTVNPLLTGTVTPRGMLVLNGNATAFEIGPNVDTFALNTTTSASAAATSATSASNSATAAGTSQTSAATSASSALTSKNDAATSATSAASSATAANTSKIASDVNKDSTILNANNSATSATNAASSATAAATSATAASGSATTASGHKDTASTFATNSSGFATNSQASATAAATSATNASSSATAAANSATALATAFTNSTIVTPTRLDAKQGTKAALVTYAATATNGQFVYATDEKKVYNVVDGALVAIGGGSVGLDTVLQYFGDEEITAWTIGNNATFLGVGALAGAFVKDTANPKNGLASYTYTQTAGSLNDYIASPASPVARKFRGREVTLYFPFSYDGLGTDIEVVLFDVTGNAIIPSSNFIPNSTGPATFKTNFVIPSTCLSLRIGFRVRVLNSGKVFRFDDIQVTGDTTVYADIAQRQSSFLNNGGSATAGSDISGAPTFTDGSGLYSYNSSTGVYTVLKNAFLHISSSVTSSSTTYTELRIIRISNGHLLGVGGNDAGTLNGSASTSFNGSLPAGETFKVQTSGAVVNPKVSIIATASSTNILTATDTFSTDTTPLVYASSSQFNVVTIANAPVGTFITFSNTAATNTRAQTTTAPTQTIASIMESGLLVSARAQTAASTAALPARVGIQIGKGWRATELMGFGAALKVDKVELKYVPNGNVDTGLIFEGYDPTTGVYWIDAGFHFNTANTSRSFVVQNAISTVNSAYVSISASRNPALTGLNIGRVAARGVNTTGTTFNHATLTTVTYDAAKMFDTHGALNPATGVFTSPESDYYSFNAQLLTSNLTYASGSILEIVAHKNGTLISSNRNVIQAAITNHFAVNISDTIYLARGDTLEIKFFQNRGSPVTIHNAAGFNYFSIAKI